MLGSYDEALTAAVVIVASLNPAALTSRLKNTQTIVEKLQRQKSMGLKGMQDIEHPSRDEALPARFAYERGRRDDADTEVVVLGAAGPEALRRTLSRYFSSVDELAQAADV